MFKLIRVSESTKAKYIEEEQLYALKAQMETAQTPRSQKRIELAIKNAKKSSTSSKSDPGEHELRRSSGCDYLLIDEAHPQDLLDLVAWTPGHRAVTFPGTRAEDLALKLVCCAWRCADEHHRRQGISGQGGHVEQVGYLRHRTPIRELPRWW